MQAKQPQQAIKKRTQTPNDVDGKKKIKKQIEKRIYLTGCCPIQQTKAGGNFFFSQANGPVEWWQPCHGSSTDNYVSDTPIASFQLTKAMTGKMRPRAGMREREISNLN